MPTWQKAVQQKDSELRGDEMGVTEKKLKARGVKFYFIIKREIPVNGQLWWKHTIATSSPLCKYFRVIDVGDFTSRGMVGWEGWKLVKIMCWDTGIVLEPAEVESFYDDMFKEFSNWFAELCERANVESEAYDFRVLIRISPQEDRGEFVGIPSLKAISAKVVSPAALLPVVPQNPEEMLEFAIKTSRLSPEGVNRLCEICDARNFAVYCSYGVRTEDDSNTLEFDMVHIGPKGRLEGKLTYSLILETSRARDRDFDKVVVLLLERFKKNQVLGSQLVKSIMNDLDKYIIQYAVGENKGGYTF